MHFLTIGSNDTSNIVEIKFFPTFSKTFVRHGMGLWTQNSFSCNLRLCREDDSHDACTTYALSEESCDFTSWIGNMIEYEQEKMTSKMTLCL